MQRRIIYTSDPREAYRALQIEIDAAIRSVLEGPAYVLGEDVDRFEKEFADFVGVAHGIGVNNGTDAIHLALRALDVGPGDEVITVSHTAVATVAGVCMSGASPVLADVDPGSRTMDPSAAGALITSRTKAILVVHLYGHPADMERISALCREHELALIEDCAQAHGAKRNGRSVGSFGDLATFSFYPTKNLGAIGDAGMVVTNDPKLKEKLLRLRQYGWARPQYSVSQGWNSRLDPLQAAILSVKLKYLKKHTERRRKLAQQYIDQLSDLNLGLPSGGAGIEHVYHLFVVEMRDEHTRDALRAFLAGSDIIAGVHYGHCVHEQPAYSEWIRTGDLTVSERLSRTVLSLPLYPELTDLDQQRVIDAVRSFFDHDQ